MKEEEKSARAEAFSSLLELQHGMSCRNRMSYIHDPAEKQYLQRPRNLNVLWDIWDIWWSRTECLTMKAEKVCAADDDFILHLKCINHKVLLTDDSD